MRVAGVVGAEVVGAEVLVVLTAPGVRAAVVLVAEARAVMVAEVRGVEAMVAGVRVRVVAVEVQ